MFQVFNWEDDKLHYRGQDNASHTLTLLPSVSEKVSSARAFNDESDSDRQYSLFQKPNESKSGAHGDLLGTGNLRLLRSSRISIAPRHSGSRRSDRLFRTDQSTRTVTCLLLPWRFQQRLRSHANCLSWADWESVKKRKNTFNETGAIATRVALRFALSKFIAKNAPPEAWNFSSACGGKPYVVNDRSIGFSFSYTQSLAVVAFTSGLAVGVDAEATGCRTISTEAMASYLSERERAELSLLPKDAKQDQFLRIWTVKEAIIKLNGSVLSENIKYIDAWEYNETRLFDCKTKQTIISVNEIPNYKDMSRKLWISMAINLPLDQKISTINTSIYLATC